MARSLVGYTQGELAEAAGVRVRTVHQIEQGWVVPPDDELRQIARALANRSAAVDDESER